MHAADSRAELRKLLFDVLVAAVEVVDAVDQVSPRATRPATTRQAEARRSVAMTVAPSSRGTPFTTAVLPLISMSAPSGAAPGHA
jgi:hypothetical protein